MFLPRIFNKQNLFFEEPLSSLFTNFYLLWTSTRTWTLFRITSPMIALHVTWPTPDVKEVWRFVKCSKWRRSKLPYAKSVTKMLERNVAAQILLTAYHCVEHSFANHIHGFTIMEHGAYYGGNPKTQLISKLNIYD